MNYSFLKYRYPEDDTEPLYYLTTITVTPTEDFDAKEFFGGSWHLTSDFERLFPDHKEQTDGKPVMIDLYEVTDKIYQLNNPFDWIVEKVGGLSKAAISLPIFAAIHEAHPIRSSGSLGGFVPDPNGKLWLVSEYRTWWPRTASARDPKGKESLLQGLVIACINSPNPRLELLSGAPILPVTEGQSSHHCSHCLISPYNICEKHCGCSS